jgi:AraC family transcriptional regulator
MNSMPTTTSASMHKNGLPPFAAASLADGSLRAVRDYPFKQSNREPKVDPRHQSVKVLPSDLVSRRVITGGGMVAELIEATSHDRIEYRHRSSSHMLVAYEQGARSEGETFVEGAPRSTLRDFGQKLTFVPAGHEYFEWYRPRTPTRVLFLYFDPTLLKGEGSQADANALSAPRLFFDNPMLWGTLVKVHGLLEDPQSVNLAYFQALGEVLIHELAQLSHADRIEARVKGGLAAWQQRTVAGYIEDHLAEQIPLATLAGLARLSPYHFSRAFKQSFGVPPHRYHTSRRIEQAKLLLEARTRSVTDIGLTLGFSETSAFSAAFRKATGLTPTGYHRSMV